MSYSPAWTEQSTTADGTSVMLRNLPNNYTRSKLLEMLDNEGFRGHYNFVCLAFPCRERGVGKPVGDRYDMTSPRYLPIDFQTEAWELLSGLESIAGRLLWDMPL